MNLLQLAERVSALGEYGDNCLDVLIEIALFEPDDAVVSVRANAAGTKVIYTACNGGEDTFWPRDWTMQKNRDATLAALRATSETSSVEGR